MLEVNLEINAKKGKMPVCVRVCVCVILEGVRLTAVRQVSRCASVRKGEWGGRFFVVLNGECEGKWSGY